MTKLSHFFRATAGVICLAVSVSAAPLERELGNGLVYVRVHALPADLPVKPSGRAPACIVDVRYVEADADAATAFAAWLKFRATPRTPVFVLANADTSVELLKSLGAHERSAGIVVVGAERSHFHPDVAVKSAPDDERKAYDALEKGAAIQTLLTDNPNKARNDEASLSKDRLAEASADAAVEVETGKKPSSPPADGAEDVTTQKKPPTPPIDAALQRAVHLHRALVALKKI